MLCEASSLHIFILSPPAICYQVGDLMHSTAKSGDFAERHTYIYLTRFTLLNKELNVQECDATEAS